MRLIPFLTAWSSQLSKGLGKPPSSCNNLMMFKYPGILEGERERAKNTAYITTVVPAAGIGV